MGMDGFGEIMRGWSLAVSNPVLVFAIVMVIMLLAPLLFERIRLPGIVGLIVAGVVVGPHGLGMFTRDGTFELLGTVGLLYLMFLAGLEINLNQFWRQRRDSLVFGGLTFLIPQVLGAVLAVPLFGMSWATAILLASMFASHTLIPYSIVVRLGLARHRAVTTAIGGTILTDTAALLVLSVVAEATVREVDAAFWFRQAGSIALLVAATLWLLPRLGYWFFRNTRPDGPAEFIFVMVAVFLSAFGAELVGLEPIIGAFLAGLALSPLIMEQSPLMRRLEFTGNALFIPFFLISVGMLVDLRVLGGGLAAWAVAAYMVAMVMLAKWLAAEFSRRVLGYSRDEGALLFGLSVNQAAATLAAVLVGYRIGLFDEAILNGAIVMILATCIVGPWMTERHGRRLAMAAAERPPPSVAEAERILVPLGNARSVDALMDLALMFRRKGAGEPLYPLCVALEGPEVERSVAAGERILGHAVVRVTAAEAPVQPVTRIDTNVVGAILRTVRELHITTVVMGWPGEASGRRAFFHSIQDRLLEQTWQMVVVARLPDPLNTTRRVVLAVPPLIDRQPGMHEVLQAVKRLADQVGARLLVVGLAESLAQVRPAVEAIRPHVPSEYRPVPAWHGLVQEVGPDLAAGDLVVLLGVRRGQLAWQPSLERFPAMLAERFPHLGLLVVSPPLVQDDARGGAAPSVEVEPEKAGTELLPGLTDARVRLDLDGLGLEPSLRILLGPSFAMQTAVLDDLVVRLLAVEPVELAPGAILLHAHVLAVEDSVVFLGVNHAAFAHPALSRPAQVLFVLLSAKQQPPELHLKALARIARLVHAPGMVDRLAAATRPEDLARLLPG
jgi:Kef-type K+ transport system membrane component KefB/mannitol/fructose-specific phosphotransferase system IIA component (Ntr-type)